MKLTQRFVLAAVLGAAASLTACDRGGTPGEDRQNVNDFSTAPPARSIETNMDSVNTQQNVQPAGGEGSAADMSQSTDNAVNSSPGGSNSTAPQNPSGTPAGAGEARNNNSLNDSKAPSQNSSAPTTTNTGQNTGTANQSSGSGRTQ
ncbi:hypothetical protein [Hymenobacter metallicola]|uniref:Lipoprotein n=1 Tax=Hymenobacter metallicola TaxID=2563114 RepID=A0A4Z0Q206_9BACT|nr:hypothetical protein [Hymenobacter metallicola]TGE23131.1 hypothetical protein E5K02_22540 [Hymenobacter metallicola]